MMMESPVSVGRSVHLLLQGRGPIPVVIVQLVLLCELRVYTVAGVFQY